MKENYTPWDIQIDHFPKRGDFKDQIIFLLRFAILAPSGHNSQPWRFSISNDSIEILINEERSLSKSDPDRRQLLIGIGCAIENILIAGDYFGFNVSVQYFPHDHKKDLVAIINFQKEEKTKIGEKNHLIFSIPLRRTNRNKYKESLPPQSFLEKIKEFSGENFSIRVIAEKEKRSQIADVVCAAQIEAMESDSFREELSHYIKNNFTKSKTGMPGFTLGLPTPISFIASRLIKRVNMSKKTAKQDEKLLKEFTPAFVIISSLHDDPMSRIRAGQIFERIWLMAENEKLSCAPLAAVVQTENYCKDLQKILGIDSCPQVFFRLGYCDKVPRHSPRLSINEVVRK